MDSALVVERTFRQESGRILATLIRACGDFDLAEEAMQEAFAVALDRWPRDGVPNNPGAWITTTARRKAIDRLRRDRTLAEKRGQLETEAAIDALTREPESTEMTKLQTTAFASSSPAATPPWRARRKLPSRSAPSVASRRPRSPARSLSPNRPWLSASSASSEKFVKLASPTACRPPTPSPSASMLAVLYLIFNEGYSATAGDVLVRRELCAEAIRLGRVLCQLMPDEPEGLGLLALMLLHDARRDARTTRDGELATLEEQDRSLWRRDQIDEGSALVEHALRLRRAGPFQLQAAIAALHCAAPAFAETDWQQIAALYGELFRLQPTPVVALNRAVAVAMATMPNDGLRLLDNPDLAASLDRYHLYHSARADLLRRDGRFAEAALAYRQAIDLTTNDIERSYLERRLREVENG